MDWPPVPSPSVGSSAVIGYLSDAHSLDTIRECCAELGPSSSTNADIRERWAPTHAALTTEARAF
eukprot:8199682-Pyramimonas_sp.AAC.1